MFAGFALFVWFPGFLHHFLLSVLPINPFPRLVLLLLSSSRSLFFLFSPFWFLPSDWRAEKVALPIFKTLLHAARFTRSIIYLSVSVGFVTRAMRWSFTESLCIAQWLGGGGLFGNVSDNHNLELSPYKRNRRLEAIYPLFHNDKFSLFICHFLFRKKGVKKIT